MEDGSSKITLGQCRAHGLQGGLSCLEIKKAVADAQGNLASQEENNTRQIKRKSDSLSQLRATEVHIREFYNMGTLPVRVIGQ